jgi:large subunit ribosomal protein L7/L12
VIAEGVWPSLNPNYFKQQEIMAKLGPFLATLMPTPTSVQQVVQQPQEQAKAEVKTEEIKTVKQPGIDPADKTYDIEMVSFAATGKIRVIKEYRALTGLGMKEAKEKIESVPFLAFKNMRKDEADEMVKKFTEYGAIMKLI